MLQRVQTEVGQRGSFGVIVDSNHSALVFEFVVCSIQTATHFFAPEAIRSSQLGCSLNSAISAACFSESIWTSAPIPKGNVASAKVTANPPSEQSWADSSKRCSMVAARNFCRADSCFKSREGGYPQTAPRISLAYSEEPNSTTARAGSADFAPLISRMSRPGLRK